jgi:hypothetical protein
LGVDGDDLLLGAEGDDTLVGGDRRRARSPAEPALDRADYSGEGLREAKAF